MRRLVEGFSIEATPRQLASAESLERLLPPGTRVYVPYLPRASMADTVDACRQLAAQGLRAVPHVPARAAASRAKLDEQLASLADAGAGSLLLIAGDRRRPAGPFTSTFDVLDTGLLQAHGFAEVGVAGHPEGHPVADAQALLDALRRKAAYASETGTRMWIVTQFAFSADPVIAWLERLRQAGIELPVRIGVPGPAKTQTLLRYALQCGVGASSRLLARRPDAVTQLLGRWTPEAMLPPLARYRSENPAAGIAGVHVFPFGGLLKSIGFFSNL
ncbi:MAG TPA: methylenetetrahydrofolate reductase [Woeseiaceae bacterium]|nr:methylenetetrahydrofolate reductase [Woeseiaceae bacterium]